MYASTGVSVGSFGEDARNRSGQLQVKCLRRKGMVIFNGREEAKEEKFTRAVQGSRGVLGYNIGSERVWKAGMVGGFAVAQEEEDFIARDHRLVFADLNCRLVFRRQGGKVEVETWDLKGLRTRQ